LLRSLWLDLPELFPESKRNSLCKDFCSWVNHVTLLEIYICPNFFISQTFLKFWNRVVLFKDFLHFTRNLYIWNYKVQAVHMWPLWSQKTVAIIFLAYGIAFKFHCWGRWVFPCCECFLFLVLVIACVLSPGTVWFRNCCL
jgi:hypothetical protein